MRSFTAKYQGRCMAVECVYGDGRIEPGDDIIYRDDEIMHAKCHRSEPPLCKSCNMFHFSTVECEDV